MEERKKRKKKGMIKGWNEGGKDVWPYTGARSQGKHSDLQRRTQHWHIFFTTRCRLNRHAHIVAPFSSGKIPLRGLRMAKERCLGCSLV